MLQSIATESEYSLKMVSVILINWNQYLLTSNCIKSLINSNNPDIRILVVDNASSDGSKEKLVQEFDSQVDFVFLEENLGFTGGCNAGIRNALNCGAQYVMLLNNDTIVDPDFLNPLMNQLKLSPSIGVVTPKIYYFIGGKTNDIWAAGGETIDWKGISRSRGKGQTDIGQFNELQEVDYASGCCLLTSKNVLEDVGLLTGDYFAYYEDVDWCIRAKKKGYKIFYVPDSIIWHYVGSSSKNNDAKEGSQSPFVHYLITRNHLWFIKSHLHGLTFFSSILFFLVNRVLFYSIVFVILNRRRKLKNLWRGFFDGLTTKPDQNNIIIVNASE